MNTGFERGSNRDCSQIHHRYLVFPSPRGPFCEPSTTYLRFNSIGSFCKGIGYKGLACYWSKYKETPEQFFFSLEAIFKRGRK